MYDKNLKDNNFSIKAKNVTLGKLNIYKIKKDTNKLLVIFLLFSMVFTPSDSMNIKIFSLLTLLIINLNVIVRYVFKYENSIILFYGMIFPMGLIIISTIINQFNLMTSISIAYIMFYLLLIPILFYYKIDYEGILLKALMLMAIVITLSGLLDLFGIYNLNNNIIMTFLKENNEAKVGLWPATTFGYVIFLKASPLLIILIGYTLRHKRYILLMITILAMAFTGTRANLYALFLVICVYYLYFEKLKISKIVIIFLAVLIFLLNINNIIEFITNASYRKEYSDITKYNHIISIAYFLNEHPLYIVTGSGLGSFFYSTGVMDYTNLTEIAYLDLFRQIGLIGFVPFVYFLVKPIRCLFIIKENNWIAISYIGYLLICFTNPLLFSSTPFTLYILVYLKYLDCKGKNI